MFEWLGKIVLKIVSLVFYPLKVRDRIVLGSIRFNELEGNLKFIYDELVAQGEKREIIQLCTKSSISPKDAFKMLKFHIKSLYYLATSKYFVIDDYFFPIYVHPHKKEVKVIQVWHGCGAFKKFGYSVVDKEFGYDKKKIKKMKIHEYYDFALVSSAYVIPFYSEAFNMDSKKIISIGVPRTDIFYRKEKNEKIKQRLYREYPFLKDKKIIIYAPTFRGKSIFFTSFDEKALDIEKLNKFLASKGFILIIKCHAYINNKKMKTIIRENEGFAYDFSDYQNINELFLISDMLISDYSSVIFEYSILEKPMIFYPPDIEEYKNERGFYLDYEKDLPGPVVKNTEEIIDWISSGAYNLEKIKQFKEKYFDAVNDGNSSSRFINELLK
jgi:CDP-ribitol ribitolphosphotransferase